MIQERSSRISFYPCFLPIHAQDGVEEEDRVEGDEEEAFFSDEGVLRPGEAPDEGAEGEEDEGVDEVFAGEGYGMDGGRRA